MCVIVRVIGSNEIKFVLDSGQHVEGKKQGLLQNDKNNLKRTPNKHLQRIREKQSGITRLPLMHILPDLFVKR